MTIAIVLCSALSDTGLTASTPHIPELRQVGRQLGCRLLLSRVSGVFGSQSKACRDLPGTVHHLLQAFLAVLAPLPHILLYLSLLTLCSLLFQGLFLLLEFGTLLHLLGVLGVHLFLILFKLLLTLLLFLSEPFD